MITAAAEFRSPLILFCCLMHLQMNSTEKTPMLMPLVLILTFLCRVDTTNEPASRWRVVGRPFNDLGLKRPSSSREQVEQNETEVESPRKFNFEKPLRFKKIFRLKHSETDEDQEVLQLASHPELENDVKVDSDLSPSIDNHLTSVTNRYEDEDEMVEVSTITTPSIEINSWMENDQDEDKSSEEQEEEIENGGSGFVYSVAQNPKLARETVLKESDTVLFSVSSFTINSTTLLVFILLAGLILLYMRNTLPVKEKGLREDKIGVERKRELPCSLNTERSKSNICYF